MSPRSALSTLPAASSRVIEEKNACIAVGKRAPMDVRMYGKRQPGGNNPLVVHFHGGAFVKGDLDSGSTVARMLADVGAVVVSLAYPLAPKNPFPDGVEAGYDVLEWAYKNRIKLAGQGARVFLAGEEAGGNIAAAVAVMSRDRGHPPLAGQILLSPMLDPCVGTASLRNAMAGATSCKWSEGWQQYLRCPMDAEHPYAVPGGSRRLANIAPTLVLCGGDDPLRDEAKVYAERLRAAGIDVTYKLLSSAENWPEALIEPVDGECTCGPAVRQQFREFFAATGKPVEPAEPDGPASAATAIPRGKGKAGSRDRLDDGRPGSA